MLQIFPIPAFDDNYIWVLQQGHHAVVIDPGDAQVVIDTLNSKQLKLSAILITHHHHDHIGGVAPLLAQYQVPVYASAYGQYIFPHIPLQDGQTIHLNDIETSLQIMWLPGHTLDHIIYFNAQYLFCGDVLFSAGCGRISEGTPAQMLTALNRIQQLDEQTKIYCTHEYTATNIAFARTLEPDNPDLNHYAERVQTLRNNKQPTLPSHLALELKVNPFLRCQNNNIRHHLGLENADELTVFSKIRELRNNY